MTISIKQGFPLRPLGSSIASDRGRTQSNDFASALTEATLAGNSRCDGQGHDERLSGREIDLLILKMQQQLNDHLFHALPANDNQESRGPLWTGGPSTVAHYPTAPAFQEQASRNRHLPQKNDGISPAVDLGQIIGQAAASYGIDENLIRSVIKVESNFEIFSTSPRGAMGLMQLMPGTARELGVRDAYDPRENIMGGTKYLKGLLDRYGGDTRLALAAYNWGMGNVEKYPGKLPQETRDYIVRVTRHYQGAGA